MTFAELYQRGYSLPAANLSCMPSLLLAGTEWWLCYCEWNKEGAVASPFCDGMVY